MKKSELLAKGLTDEQAAAVLEMHKAGIAKAAPDLALVEQLKAEKLAAEALAQEKEEARLKAAGDLDGLKKHYEQQAKELKSKADQEVRAAKEALTLRDQALALTHKNLAKGKILDSVDPRYKFAAEAMLDNMIAVTHDESGAARYNIKLGNQDHANEADFLNAAKHDQNWQNFLKAEQNSGSGAASKGGSGSASGDDEYAAFDARLARDGLDKSQI